MVEKHDVGRSIAGTWVYVNDKAQRGGGFHKKLCGARIFIFALLLLRASCSRCAKPLVICKRGDSAIDSGYRLTIRHVASLGKAIRQRSRQRNEKVVIANEKEEQTTSLKTGKTCKAVRAGKK